MKYDRKKCGTMLSLLASAILTAACYAPQLTPLVRATRYNPPSIVLPQLGVAIDLDALRDSWAIYPMGNNHTRSRNYQGGSKGFATITPYRGIANVDPNNPPSTTVLFAHITNRGPGIDKRYNLKRMSAAEYYVIVDADPASPRMARWRILEVPSAPMGVVSFVKRGDEDMSGHLVHCQGHVQKTQDEADFWNCEDGDGDHASAFSSATAFASAGSMPIGREFWNNVFGSKSKSALRVNGGDETGWASCSGGCCTLAF